MYLAVGYQGRFQQHPGDKHWIVLKCMLSYLKGILDLKILNFKKHIGFPGAYWGSFDKKSTIGYIFYVFDCPISWCSKKQQTEATLTSEAEYIVLSPSVSKNFPR